MLWDKDPAPVIWKSFKLQNIWSHLGLFYFKKSLYKYIDFYK